MEAEAPTQVWGKRKQPLEHRSHERINKLAAPIAIILAWVNNVTQLDERLIIEQDEVDMVHNSVDKLEDILEGKVTSLQGELVDTIAKLEVLNIAFGHKHNTTVASNSLP